MNRAAPASEADRRPSVRILVLCGLISSMVYIAIDVIGALSFPDYDYSAQAISEMSAIGAPTAGLLAPMYHAWSLPLRWSAGFMLGVAIVGTGFPLFPMNQRSAEPTIDDTMHLAVAGTMMLLLSGAILAGARALRGRL